MKKLSVGLLTVTLLVSGFLFSCIGKKNNNTGELTFDSISINETAHLFADTAKPACNLVVDFTFIDKSADELLKDSLNAYFFAVCFGDKYIGMTPAEAVKEYAENYVNEYRGDLEPMYAEDEKNNKTTGVTIGSWYSYYRTIESSIPFYEKDVLVYRVHYAEYTGGAHGNYVNTFLNMDLNTMRPIHLSDVFVEGYQESLTDLIWNQLMATNQATTREELEEMGYGSTGEIAPIENFYLSKKGITFYYNVYDITPYSMGPVEVELPYEMLEHLFNSNPILNSLRN